ncbi:endonuclease/exonuclease/phosphatase family protein [Glutamicibacter sp.]|uniref:endonuclease/exonuclease/phosphatase family protein n=1 Tax=Glutamicibacter sp. TaxID=1931995 RepID=UPI002B466F52|nr:endonuclease/exonuclease/phosphatase family protein [Glutamicibacter sp.]HJX79913.1 endonuclease/exonuclease/phosphatase family protein [Glutamicibacter sp.]
MRKDGQQQQKHTFLILLIVISALIAVLPYVPWLAGGIIPKVQAFASWLLLVPLGALIFTLLTRKRRTAIAIGVLLFIGLIPQVHIAPAGPSETGAELRVLSFNAYLAEANSNELAALIKDEQPDLLILVETSERLHQDLTSLGALEGLDFRTAPAPAGGVRDTVIFSKNPMTEIDSGLSERDTGWFAMPTVEVEVAQQRVLLAGVHVYPPLKNAQQWREGLSAIDTWVHAHPESPMILAGDFNSTSGHRLYRDAVAGLTEASGLRPLATWPRTMLPFPVIEIDHILGRDVTFAQTGATPISGSDHLAVHTTARF